MSAASPWLNQDQDYLRYGVSDVAYERIPSQLLPLLRADSIGSTTRSNNHITVRFTGCDGYSYAVQTSSNLANWVSVSTNIPVDGYFTLPGAVSAGTTKCFYRSVLLP